MDTSNAFSISFGSLFWAAYLVGIVYSIIDLVKRPVPGKVGWIAAILLFPFAWIIYLLFTPKLPSTGDGVITGVPQQEQIEKSEPSTESTQSEYLTNNTNVLGHHADSANSKTLNIFRIVGIVLTVVACLAGLAMVGFVLLMFIALSSYGSNK